MKISLFRSRDQFTCISVWKITSSITRVVLILFATRHCTFAKIIGHFFYSIIRIITKMKNCTPAFLFILIHRTLGIFRMLSLFFAMGGLHHLSILNVFLLKSVIIDICNFWIFLSLQFLNYFSELSVLDIFLIKEVYIFRSNFLRALKQIP